MTTTKAYEQAVEAKQYHLNQVELHNTLLMEANRAGSRELADYHRTQAAAHLEQAAEAQAVVKAAYLADRERNEAAKARYEQLIAEERRDFSTTDAYQMTEHEIAVFSKVGAYVRALAMGDKEVVALSMLRNRGEAPPAAHIAEYKALTDCQCADCEWCDDNSSTAKEVAAEWAAERVVAAE